MKMPMLVLSCVVCFAAFASAQESGADAASESRYNSLGFRLARGVK